MNHFTTLALGLLARALSVVAAHYSDWLLNKLAQGCDAGFGFFRDFKRFWARLLTTVAYQLGSRRGQAGAYEEEEWQPELYPAQ
ncbi:MAG: hypothetical protein JNM56_10285 [Planctomycetia bacterium]|nr:hypothetical protein [Planctomycetia bacterium]